MFGLYAVVALTTCLILALRATVLVGRGVDRRGGLWRDRRGACVDREEQVQEGVRAVPEQTVESVKEDFEWTKCCAREGRRRAA